ncbi:MAG: SDR family NAD(P)-dependent oxidoreductase, partial [Proteobacteria bacterium]|nr:SDR family NAD(P)-dependent oxidoreductase [Pseudomonadota bacterium]
MNILIIGATFGIGNALAEKYSDQCENLVLLGRTEARLTQLQKDFANKKARILTEILDVTQEEDCQKKLSSLIEKISKSVKARKQGLPVRFVYDAAMPNDMLRYIMR